ncbi:hypothetical protein [Teichococcus vastitatis]|uniref:hypothetical protein n=1 Tax=Teichococcus vastitatis TaxID=2307076 RepID=UPI000E728ABD|nr:hypothetical protein [Pseudoroseomonas vastitatis]
MTKMLKPTQTPTTETAATVVQTDLGPVTATGGMNPENPFKGMGGSDNPMFNSMLYREVLGVAFGRPAGDEEQKSRIGSAAAQAMAGFQPKDEVEGLLAAQAVALHFAAMECLRRSVIPDQPSEIAAKMRKDGANLARSMVEMTEALQRRRGKGPQVVRVERVVVQEGGQAIVGNVNSEGNR